MASFDCLDSESGMSTAIAAKEVAAARATKAARNSGSTWIGTHLLRQLNAVEGHLPLPLPPTPEFHDYPMRRIEKRFH